jgi:hypothetical protein
MSAKKAGALGRAYRRLNEEREWMKQCGGNLAGYIIKYGSKNDPEHHGDGGEAIYEADLAKVRQYEEEVAALADEK